MLDTWFCVIIGIASALEFVARSIRDVRVAAVAPPERVVDRRLGRLGEMRRPHQRAHGPTCKTICRCPSSWEYMARTLGGLPDHLVADRDQTPS